MCSNLKKDWDESYWDDSLGWFSCGGTSSQSSVKKATKNNMVATQLMILTGREPIRRTAW